MPENHPLRDPITWALALAFTGLGWAAWLAVPGLWTAAVCAAAAC